MNHADPHLPELSGRRKPPRRQLHYYWPRLKFYNWPYVFGQLFVFAPYRLYRQQGKAFAPKFMQLLYAGSTMSPGDLIAMLGFDITTPEFWKLGMKQAEALLATLETLVR